MPAQNTTRHDVWASGDAYEPFVGRWSRRVAREFVGWLAQAADSRWLDVGCGSGALTQTVLATASPCEVLGVDPSEGFIAHARRHTQDSRAKFQVGDAQALPVANSDFDVAVAGLVLNFVPDPARAVTEMHRAVRVGGTVAAHVWDYADGMQLLRRFWDAAAPFTPSPRYCSAPDCAGASCWRCAGRTSISPAQHCVSSRRSRKPSVAAWYSRHQRPGTAGAP